jgi:hypothetical protein
MRVLGIDPGPNPPSTSGTSPDVSTQAHQLPVQLPLNLVIDLMVIT